jgi:hypothetical protein
VFAETFPTTPVSVGFTVLALTKYATVLYDHSISNSCINLIIRMSFLSGIFLFHNEIQCRLVVFSYYFNRLADYRDTVFEYYVTRGNVIFLVFIFHLS